MTRTERFSIIQRMLRTRRNVSFAELQARLEVSRATVFRDLRDLRDRLGVPVVFDPECSTYRLDSSSEYRELPGIWFSPAEMHALLSMQQLLAAFDTSGLLAEHVGPLRERLLGMLESRADSAAEIARRVRIISAAARPFAAHHFQSIAAALMERRRLRITYAARSQGKTTTRDVSPQRLLHYRDNWYLAAWCHLRNELRSFAVDAIVDVETLGDTAGEIAEDQLDAALGAGYGIFIGRSVRWATLHFTARRARWVAAEHWHPAQQGEFLADGSYRLRVPYSADPELIMDILKYGPDCEVMAPAELRAKVVGLLRDAIGRYGDE
ncbi:helix-turn-helix transcriptional regulator [Azonexus sp.]|uniref:helix-turn-helix transcriptional regulator n=1 Tax=Azonexus sp. TaxID=1872668 RepID=UPI0035B242DC